MSPQEIQSIKSRFGIIGDSTSLNYAIQIAAQVAPTDLTVLITGESGSGKESFSKIIHQLSTRKHGQFIAINCGAIPEGTIDSELFGHEKGAFTGAVDARKGYFEVTDGGTIFLDEIAEMPLSTQARLLRVLENKEFIRVGSSKIMKTDVRVVAATNVNLMQAVEKGRFREDLYYRLNTVPIFVPPLRDRGNDVLMLFRKFTADFSERQRIRPIQLTEDAREVLLSYRFPGNIRQLKNLAEQVSILEEERLVNGRTLLKYIPDAQRSSLPDVFRDQQSQNQDFSEREILYKVLFDLKRDVTELKKLFVEMAQNGTGDGEILRQHANLFQGVHDEPVNFSEPNTPTRYLPVSTTSNQSPSVFSIDSSNEPSFVDVTEESEDESLSLEKKEKEMIIKALRKNGNKRKNAAQALGISERTLYRKIKQYEIDEE
ncbi:sigma-54-dependent Fis family transcriptional regulator [Siphonobacter sp. SORGH_AS_0500]|uniref:sigma-54 interaction domain-containing protein n=1 Tax=Siphonobacter sp. SORGH_AS_0500 TaxID=1864824 RepID=UPI000CAB424D|nr:sigma-54 dependent transcriptional regulator [Siphonobacter sp. SORGH_AS_0500]MDR6194677.1 transcriptional regulator with PAS, ATPase and Fis domain [Siphonobacter sp. SORGH_AS_0500]PKK35510.1 sigma-54-dependent Fis family transcriptional regulator [Siphonobacter sp. SORGH_AS_0500]